MSAPSFKRAKTMKGKRHLESREPLIVENVKKVFFLHGTKCPQMVQAVFKDWAALTKPHSKIFSRKRDLRPMDDEAALEGLSGKYDASLFAVGTSNKKRPNAITFARMFGNRLLDMCEVTVESFKPIASYKGVAKPSMGNKPCVLFQGHCWDQDSDFEGLRSMLLDVFRGPVINNLFLAGVDRVVVFSADPPRIRMQQYLISFKKSGTRLPIVHLEECGPCVNMTLGRTRWAAEDLMRQALQVPKALKSRKVKNIEYTPMGDKTGRVHMQKQDLNTLQVRKVRALKKDATKSKPNGAGKRNAAQADTVTPMDADEE